MHPIKKFNSINVVPHAKGEGRIITFWGKKVFENESECLAENK